MAGLDLNYEEEMKIVKQEVGDQKEISYKLGEPYLVNPNIRQPVGQFVGDSIAQVHASNSVSIQNPCNEFNISPDGRFATIQSNGNANLQFDSAGRRIYPSQGNQMQNAPYATPPRTKEEEELDLKIQKVQAKQQVTFRKITALNQRDEKEMYALRKKQSVRTQKVTMSKSHQALVKENSRLQTERNAIRREINLEAQRNANRKKFMEDFLRDAKARDVNQDATLVLAEAGKAFDILNPD